MSSDTIVSTKPATGEVLAELACATPEEVQAAVARARRAQPKWQATPVTKRIAVLRRFQDLLARPSPRNRPAICREAGKPTAEALTTEVLVVLDAAEFCIRNAHRFLRDQPVPHGNLAMKTKRGKLVREAVRRDRDYLALELSVLDPGRGNARRTGHGQRGRA